MFCEQKKSCSWDKAGNNHFWYCHSIRSIPVAGIRGQGEVGLCPEGGGGGVGGGGGGAGGGGGGRYRYTSGQNVAHEIQICKKNFRPSAEN